MRGSSSLAEVSDLVFSVSEDEADLDFDVVESFLGSSLLLSDLSLGFEGVLELDDFASSGCLPLTPSLHPTK